MRIFSQSAVIKAFCVGALALTPSLAVATAGLPALPALPPIPGSQTIPAQAAAPSSPAPSIPLPPGMGAAQQAAQSLEAANDPKKPEADPKLANLPVEPEPESADRPAGVMMPPQPIAPQAEAKPEATPALPVVSVPPPILLPTPDPSKEAAIERPGASKNWPIMGDAAGPTWKTKLAPQVIPPKTRFNYRRQLLPGTIYRPQYDANNHHLPKAVYVEDYEQEFFSAVARNDIDATRALLNTGRAASLTTAEGEPALDIARKSGARDTERLLKARGALNKN
jgi:hypothetical protein